MEKSINKTRGSSKGDQEPALVNGVFKRTWVSYKCGSRGPPLAAGRSRDLSTIWQGIRRVKTHVIKRRNTRHCIIPILVSTLHNYLDRELIRNW
jgi:hypothetical protein